MSNELVKQNNWFQRHWKWMLPLVVVGILTATLFASLTAGHLGDFGKAYAEPQLFKGALDLAQQNREVTELLGQLEPVGNMAILEGDIEYTHESNHVNLSVRVTGTKGKANMQVIANRINDSWEYQKVSIRVKNPPEKRQTIMVK
ncbi:cytochrome c oxidase assembly factor Coa1 family protein [Aequorivita capsosiphonis]|uniref:cytochrome c oxidase assembly factor Coa1 family protein n=1 Tax=Aequorivita capsosiphonis TaxID=487317 RepID=UPI00047EEAE6|nr:cytochrome c oxidase assembly factor Coa1 family protein [Aequorivita capsosiphonis]